MVTANQSALLTAGALAVAGSVYLLLASRGKKARVKYIIGKVNYQADSVPASLRSSGKVYVDRRTTGADNPPVGEAAREVAVPVRDARDLDLSIDTNGMLVYHACVPIDFADKNAVVRFYYPSCCDLVKQYTGAKHVLAFDHNLRGAAVGSWMNKSEDNGKTAPLDEQYVSPACIVHGDYTVTSAPLRLRMLTQPPKANDTWGVVTDGKPLIAPEDIEERLKRRYMFINVWRSIGDDPVRDMPLGVVDAMTVPNEDLVTFEVRYVDRTGENYLAKYSPPNGVADDGYHKWLYFPEMTKHEAILLKTWDSAGVQFRGCEGGGHTGGADGTWLLPKTERSTFCLHSAFKDDSAPADCEKRRSIEVRLVAFF